MSHQRIIIIILQNFFIQSYLFTSATDIYNRRVCPSVNVCVIREAAACRVPPRWWGCIKTIKHGPRPILHPRPQPLRITPVDDFLPHDSHLCTHDPWYYYYDADTRKERFFSTFPFFFSTIAGNKVIKLIARACTHIHTYYLFTWYTFY